MLSSKVVSGQGAVTRLDIVNIVNTLKADIGLCSSYPTSIRFNLLKSPLQPVDRSTIILNTESLSIDSRLSLSELLLEY